MKKVLASFILAASAVLYACAPVTAQAATGNTVQGMSAEERHAFLFGNLEGIISSLPAGTLCIPAGVNYNQGIAIVEKFMRDNPEITHLPISTITMGVMAGKFKCPEGTSQPKKPKTGKELNL